MVGKGVRNHLDDVTSVSLSFEVESKTEFDSAVRTIKRQTTVHAVRPGLTCCDKDLSSRIEVVLLFCCFILGQMHGREGKRPRELHLQLHVIFTSASPVKGSRS